MSDDGWSGPQRVAAFLLSLDREAAGEVLRHLGEDVLPDVAEAMAELDPRRATRERVDAPVSYTHLTLPTIYSV